MPIEFPCVKCGSALRVPDEIAGRKAQCPQCQEIQIVPQASVLPPDSAPQHSPYQQWSGSGDSSRDSFAPPQHDAFSGNAPKTPPHRHPEFQDTGNPFQPPMGHADSFGFSPIGAPGELLHTKIGFSWLFHTVWDIFFARIADFLVLGLIVTVVSLVFFVPYYVFVTLAQTIEGGGVLFGVLAAVSYTLAIITGWIVQVGAMRLSLSIVRGEPAKYSLIFKNFGETVKCLLAVLFMSIVVGLVMIVYIAVAGILVGLLLYAFGNAEAPMFLVGIIIVVLAIPFYVLFVAVSIRFVGCWGFILDRGEGPVQSLWSSWRYTSGNAMALFGTFAVYYLLGTLFGCITCYLGFILVIPMMTCISAVAYLGMTGQPIVNPKLRFAPSPGQDFNVDGPVNW